MPLSGRLIFGEMNLFSEGEALASFASTSIGRHALPLCARASVNGARAGQCRPADRQSRWGGSIGQGLAL